MANRVYENCLVLEALNHVDDWNKENKKKRKNKKVERRRNKISKNSSNGVLYVCKKDGITQASYKEHSMRLRQEVIDYISDIYVDEMEVPYVYTHYQEVYYFSEYYLGDHLIRAHNNYRSRDPWLDWVMVRWEKSDDIKDYDKIAEECNLHFGEEDDVEVENFFYAPARVLCFIKPNEGPYQAIVECCHFECKKHSKSMFTNVWKRVQWS